MNLAHSTVASWETGNSGKSWYYSLESEVYRAGRQAGNSGRISRLQPWGKFCFFFGKPQSLLFRPSPDWTRPTQVGGDWLHLKPTDGKCYSQLMVNVLLLKQELITSTADRMPLSYSKDSWLWASKVFRCINGWWKGKWYAGNNLYLHIVFNFHNMKRKRIGIPHSPKQFWKIACIRLIWEGLDEENISWKLFSF